MSIIKPIDLRGTPGLREAIAAVISGKAGMMQWSEDVNLKLKREGDKAVLVITSGKAEVVLRGLPDPDFIKAEIHPDHAIVSVSIANVRVNY
mgnify:CR=1 FL=1